jgi:polygalacturonase
MAGPISRRTLLLGGLTVAGSVAVPGLARTAVAETTGMTGMTSGTAVAASDLPWAEARAIAATTLLPTFPAATFDIRSYGAVADGRTDNTEAFRRAITACNTAGGGTVAVPAGTYLTGAIHLRSNVNLRLDGATLLFSGDATKYPTVLTRYEGIECMNHSPMIYAYRERNIALTGNGTLDGSGTAAWNIGSDRSFLESWVNSGITDPRKRIIPGSGHALRSAFVEPYGCDRVLIQGITLRGAMFWQLHPTLCTNVTVDAVTTDGSRVYPNTDSCDPESCDHVVIKNSVLRANDDNVAIKSGRDADGRRVNVPCQNIVIFGNTMDGASGAITCGSELTGGIQHVYAYANTLIGATARGLYVKSNTLRGGYVRDVHIDRMTGTMRAAFVIMQMNYKNQTGPYLPDFGGITITNSSCTKTPRVFDVQGLASSHVHGFVVRDSSFQGVTTPSNVFRYVDGRRFTNVRINGATVTG